MVVVNHNGGSEAADNIAAMSRDLAEAQIVVVDNASSDGSLELIRSALPDVSIVPAHENRGYASGVNAGIRASDGDIIIVLNPDITPEPGSLRRLRDVVASDDTFGIVGGLVLRPNGAVDPNCMRAYPAVGDILREGFFIRPRSRRILAPVTAASAVDDVDVVSGSVMALRRDAIDRIGLMDEQFFLYREDVEWCRRAREKGLRVAVARAARFRHAGGASTRSVEVVAFAARVLSDFRYYCDIEGVPEEVVRRRWRIRLRFRSLLYSLDAAIGILGRRESSRLRAAAYRAIDGETAGLRWSEPYDGQACHPSRFEGLPLPTPRDTRDTRPRVLLIVPDLGYGGSQRRVEHMVTGPLSDDFDFEVLCLRELGEIGRRLTGSVRIHRPRVESWRRSSTWSRIRSYCALLEPDAVYSATLPADLAALFGFAGRVPWVSAKVSIDTWMSPWISLVEWFVARRADVVYAVGDEIARAKSRLSRRGMMLPVVPNPPMIAFSKESPRGFPADGPVRVAVVGRLEPVKRTETFLRTAAELERRGPGRFRYEVVGGGSELDALRRLSVELGLGEVVTFTGPVSDVAGVLDRADIVPLFSEGEGNPNTVLETIARGRVPLVSGAGGAADGLPACLRDCVVSSTDPESFAGAIEGVVARERHYLDRVEAARRELEAVPGAFRKAMRSIFNEALGDRRRVRVLHLITRLIVGGAQENTIASVERVDPERFDSHMWIGPQTGSEGSLLDNARRRGIVVKILPDLVREINPARDLLVTCQLVRLLRRGRFDVIHTHSSKAGIVGRIAARVAGVPHVVHTVHGWGFHERMHPLVKSFYVILERIMRPWTSALVSVSNRTTRIGLEEGIGTAESYRMIRSGIPLARFHPDAGRRALLRDRLGYSDDEIVIGSVGRLSAQKNPMDFVATAERLTADFFNLRFVYVGDGPMREEVLAAAAAAGVDDRIDFLGLRDDVPDLLRAMDVFILTSLWEGLPRVVPQALATGVPVVAYDIAGIEEAVIEGRNGHLVEPGDVEGMVERLRPLLADDSLRAAMSSCALEEFDDSFSEDRMIADLESLYGGLTGHRDAAARP